MHLEKLAFGNFFECADEVCSPPRKLILVAKICLLLYNAIMGKKEKLIERLKSKPKDFTFDEAETLLRYLSYSRSNKGKTSGSRVIFVSERHSAILLHKPHPGNELKNYQVAQLLDILRQENII